MRRWDRLTGGLVLAFAVYTMITAVRLGYWQGRIPGPGGRAFRGLHRRT